MAPRRPDESDDVIGHLLPDVEGAHCVLECPDVRRREDLGHVIEWFAAIDVAAGDPCLGRRVRITHP